MEIYAKICRTECVLKGKLFMKIVQKKAFYLTTKKKLMKIIKNSVVFQGKVKEKEFLHEREKFS